MRRITPSERTLLSLIYQAGGSACPGESAHMGAEIRRLVRRLEYRDLLRIEDTSDGPRLHITERGMQEIGNAD